MVWVSRVQLDVSIVLNVVLFSGAYTSSKTLNMYCLLHANYVSIKQFKIKVETLLQGSFS